MVTRRRLLQGAGLAAATISAPAILTGAAREPLIVSAYGGFFENTLKATVVKQFTEETGIPVQTVSQPGSDEWIFGLVRAARAGLAPVDVTTTTQVQLLRMMGMGNVIAPINDAIMPNVAAVPPEYFVRKDGRTHGIGTVSWYQTLVINPDVVSTPPESWRQVLESPDYRSRLALNGNYNGGLLEIIARTYFDGNETLATDEGVDAVIDKIAALKSQVRLWWTSESQMEQALRNQEVIAGTYFHDVANLLQSEGFPIRSLFPREGAVIGVGHMSILSTSEKKDMALAYINFCARPDIQAMFATEMRLNPVLPRSRLTLTDAEYAAVGSELPPIFPAAELLVERADSVQRRWQRMITS